MKRSALVVMPWFSTDPWRIKSMQYVTGKLASYGLSVATAPSPIDPFNRAAAKNAGAIERRPFEDVLIFHDADMLLKPEAYAELEERARDTDKLVIGFTEYRALTQEATAMVLNGTLDDPWAGTVSQVLVSFSVGGILAVSAKLFADIGGYDTRFKGWGCEDFAFAISAWTLRDGYERLPGSAVHMFHEHGSATQSDDDERFNGQLLGRYNKVTGVDDLRLVQTTD